MSPRKDGRTTFRLPTEELECYSRFCEQLEKFPLSEFVRVSCHIFWSELNGLISEAFESFCSVDHMLAETAARRLADMVVVGLRARRPRTYVIELKSIKKTNETRYWLWVLIEGTEIYYGLTKQTKCGESFASAIGYDFNGERITFENGYDDCGGFLAYVRDRQCKGSGVYNFGKGYL